MNNRGSTNIFLNLLNRLKGKRAPAAAEPFVAPELQSESNAEYITVYYFAGTARSFGIGHVAIFDGNKYYSFPSQTKNIGSPDRLAQCVNADVGIYGQAYPVILPKTQKLLNNLNQIQKAVAGRYLTKTVIDVAVDSTGAETGQDYSLIANNCADMTRGYLLEAGYTEMDWIRSKGLYVLTPSDVAERARSVGLKMMLQDIERDRKLNRDTEEINVMRDFLSRFKKDLDKTNLKGTLIHDIPTGIKELKLMMNLAAIEDWDNPDVVKKLYYDLKVKLAQLHYSNSISSMTRSPETHEFYSKWLRETFLDIERFVDAREIGAGTKARPAAAHVNIQTENVPLRTRPDWTMNNIRPLINSFEAVYHQLGRSTHRKAVKKLVELSNQPDTSVESVTRFLEAELKNAMKNGFIFNFSRNPADKFIRKVNENPDSYHYPRMIAFVLKIIYRNNPDAHDKELVKVVNGLKTNLDMPEYKRFTEFSSRTDSGLIKEEQKRRAQWQDKVDKFNKDLDQLHTKFKTQAGRLPADIDATITQLLTAISSIYDKLKDAGSPEGIEKVKESLDKARRQYAHRTEHIGWFERNDKADAFIANQLLSIGIYINQKAELITSGEKLAVHAMTEHPHAGKAP